MTAPLDQPLPGANPVQAVKRYFLRYAQFSGRSSRSEYWWTALMNVVVIIGLLGVEAALTQDSPNTGQPGIALFLVYEIVTFVPSLAVLVRRLHDANMSGMLAALLVFGGLGGLVLAILAATPPKPEGQRFDARHTQTLNTQQN